MLPSNSITKYYVILGRFDCYVALWGVGYPTHVCPPVAYVHAKMLHVGVTTLMMVS